MLTKYDRIGSDYNTTRKADPYLVGRLLHHLDARADGKYLDIGCGTGNYTIALHHKGLEFIGVDPSERMLKVARQNCSTIDWRKGTAEDIPLESGAVDGIMGSLTLHHWANIDQGIAALWRVLKPQGRIVLFTSTPAQMSGYWLHHYFPIMLRDSMKQMPSYELLESSLIKNGFTELSTEKYFVRESLQDLFLYSGKHAPDRYLDAKMRWGISSFSALANRREVQEGLKRLEMDIKSGEIFDIIDSYENDAGDYLYVTAKKH